MHIIPSVNGVCVDEIVNVTISTGQTNSHGDAITLLINNRVCSSSSHSNDIVKCDEPYNIIHHTLSYTLNAINAGTVSVKTHTNYHGATWYSDSKVINVMEQCNESKCDNSLLY